MPRTRPKADTRITAAINLIGLVYLSLSTSGHAAKPAGMQHRVVLQLAEDSLDVLIEVYYPPGMQAGLLLRQAGITVQSPIPDNKAKALAARMGHTVLQKMQFTNLASGKVYPLRIQKSDLHLQRRVHSDPLGVGVRASVLVPLAKVIMGQELYLSVELTRQLRATHLIVSTIGSTCLLTSSQGVFSSPEILHSGTLHRHQPVRLHLRVAPCPAVQRKEQRE